MRFQDFIPNSPAIGQPLIVTVPTSGAELSMLVACRFELDNGSAGTIRPVVALDDGELSNGASCPYSVTGGQLLAGFTAFVNAMRDVEAEPVPQLVNEAVSGLLALAGPAVGTVLSVRLPKIFHAQKITVTMTAAGMAAGVEITAPRLLVAYGTWDELARL